MSKMEESDSDGSTSDSSSDSDAEMDIDVDTLTTELTSNQEILQKEPFNYGAHEKVITTLGQLYRATCIGGQKGNDELFEQLENARKKMSEIYPLTESLWMAWLSDCVKHGTDREIVFKLCDTAVQDYFMPQFWAEYVQFSLCLMAEPDGIEKIRDIYERAIADVGLHPKVTLVWEAAREFEIAVHSMVSESSTDQETINIQTEKVHALFKRQLSVPHFHIKSTWQELCDWLKQAPKQNVLKVYEAATNQMTQRRSFEEEIENTKPCNLEAYLKYIEFEMKNDNPSRILITFERAITDNCLNPDIWLQYINYLNKLKDSFRLSSVCHRAIRNCPASSQIWLEYLIFLERSSEPHEKIDKLFKEACKSGITEAAEVVSLWTWFCDYSRRKYIGQESFTEEDKENLRTTFRIADGTLIKYYGPQGDYNCTILSYWATIEARIFKDVAKARELWNQIMTRNHHGSKAEMWAKYLDLEKTFHDPKTCRKLFQRALNSANDDPEKISQMYLEFERMFGTIADLDDAKQRISGQMARIAARREQVSTKTISPTSNVSKASKRNLQKSKPSKDIKPQDEESEPPPFKKPNIPPPKPQAALRPKSIIDQMKSEATTSSVEVPKPKKNDAKKTIFVSNLSYAIDELVVRDALASCGEIVDIRMPILPSGKKKGFCYVEFSTKEGYENSLKLDRKFVDNRPMFISPYSKEENRQVQFLFATGLEKKKLFVKNLPKTLSKEGIENVFNQYGQVKDLRVVTYRNGISKGLAYVEFDSEALAEEIRLKTDQLQIGDHKIEVAISHPPSKQAHSAFEKERPAPERKSRLSFVPRALATNKTNNSTLDTQSVSSTNGVKHSDSKDAKPKNNDEFRAMLLNKD